VRSLRHPLLLVLVAASALLATGGLLAQPSAPPAAPAAAEPRVALVIGNGAYTAASALPNPGNDAEDMAAALRKLGFQVTLRKNAGHRDMVEAINAFGRELRKGGVGQGGVGLFYFAGHGVQSKGRNYLIPVSANIGSEAELEFETVDADRVLAAMDEAGNRVNLVILDACRNNPFRGMSRAATRGLAQMEAAQGKYIAFATSPGAVALDGEGRNGVYTKHLLKSLEHADSDIDKVFRRVTADVSRETQGKQVPWVSSSLTGDFYFRPRRAVAAVAPAAAPVPVPADVAAYDRVFWDQVKSSANPDELQAYLDQFPNGIFRGLAQARLKALAQARPTQQAAAAAPPTAPRVRTGEATPGGTSAGFNVAALPYLSSGAKTSIEKEIIGPDKPHKALAITEAGGWGGAVDQKSPAGARAYALELCRLRNRRHPCFLAMVDGESLLGTSYSSESLAEGAIALLARAPLEAEFYANEDRDDGIAPTTSRRAAPMHAATPRSVPGAKTITTRQLVELYKGGARFPLINVLDWTEGSFALPGTSWIQGMGKTKLSASDTAQLRTLLEQIAPDKAAPLVVYCLSWECWLSYNATLTAVSLGYTNVHWYRGGTTAWNQALLPVVRTRLLKQL
jgi:PQQ-dependent catabolism-associated CXXCW motif protein